jgi:hypothetical protein
MTPTVIGVIVSGLSGVGNGVGEIGGMTGGVSGDDRGFEREMGGGGRFFCGFGRGVSSVLGADFQGVKEKNCYHGRKKFFPPMEKNGASDDDDTADSGGHLFLHRG